jgi:hypothetical protein
LGRGFRTGAAEAAGSTFSYPETETPFPAQIIRDSGATDKINMGNMLAVTTASAKVFDGTANARPSALSSCDRFVFAQHTFGVYKHGKTTSYYDPLVNKGPYKDRLENIEWVTTRRLPDTPEGKEDWLLWGRGKVGRLTQYAPWVTPENGLNYYTYQVHTLEREFDFGVWDVNRCQSGYILMSDKIEYDPYLERGWKSIHRGAALDRGGDPPLDRTLVVLKDGNFVVDLPDWTYRVSMNLGDPAPNPGQTFPRKTQISLDGGKKWFTVGLPTQGGIVAWPGNDEQAKKAAEVKVKKQLTICLRAAGGDKDRVAITALTVTAVEPPPHSSSTITTSAGMFDESGIGSSFMALATQPVNDVAASAASLVHTAFAAPTDGTLGPKPAELAKAKDDVLQEAAQGSLRGSQTVPSETARIDNALSFLALDRVAKRRVASTASRVDEALATEVARDWRHPTIDSFLEPRPSAMPGIPCWSAALQSQ